MTTEVVIPPKPKRRILSISVRVLMLMVLVAAAWLARETNRARTQRRAVAAITGAGGAVLYDWEEPQNWQPTPGAKPWAPAWLRRRLGDELFQDVVAVRFHNRARLNAETMALVGSLSHIKELNLATSPLTGADIAALANLKRLRVLFLHLNPKLTDDDLTALSGLTNLEHLTLHWTPVREGTKHLRNLSRLQFLSLSHCNLNDAGLKSLEGMTSLKELTLYDNPVSDQAVRDLIAKLPATRGLYFPND